MAYKFNITYSMQDEDFDSIDYAIYATIEKEVRQHINTDHGLLPTELYEKALQHALWSLGKEK